MRPLLVVMSLAAASAVAQTRAPDRPSSTRTELVFEGDLIEGTTQTPDVELLTNESRPKHEGLLRVRTDFRREVLSSVSQL